MARPIAKEPRDYRVTVRFTEKEMAELEQRMEEDGYLAKPRYIRDCVLKRKHVSKRIVDEKLETRISRLITQITKIGVNYNQVARKYQRSLGFLKKSGDPAISEKATIYYMKQLMELTQQVKECTDQVLETVTKLEQRA